MRRGPLIAIPMMFVTGASSAEPPPSGNDADVDMIASDRDGVADEVRPMRLDEDVARAICNQPFGGRYAALGLWALGDELVAIELRGDLTAFSHPPSVFFGPDGVERAVLNETPVIPGSPDAEAAAATLDAATSGGALVETRSCARYWIDLPPE